MSTQYASSAAGIVIIGAGIAGLHLGLFLLQHGVPVTIYSDRSPAQLRAGRLPNSVALMGATRARHAALDIHDWDAPEFDTPDMHLYVGGPQPLSFVGRAAAPMIFLDMRLYLPRLLEEFAMQGGRIVQRDLTVNDVTDLAEQAALVVVATGRNGLTQLFPRRPEASPYDQPQRLLMVGLFQGIQPLTPPGMCFHIAPGQGELFESRFLTFGGRLASLLLEALPGSDLAVMNRLSYEENPKRFHAMLLELLQAYAPLTAARIDPTAFALHRPLDLLQGAVTPIVRRAYAPLANGRFALALGDTHITHDPLAGQGANAASRAAWLMGETIVEALKNGDPFDEAFSQRLEARLWAALEPVTALSNAMLQPPPPHLIELLVAASQIPAVADTFVTNFNMPERNWALLSSPDRTETFLQDFGWTPAAMAALA